MNIRTAALLAGAITCAFSCGRDSIDVSSAAGPEPGALEITQISMSGCSRCTIQVTGQATLGIAAGEDGPTRDSRLAVDTRGRWYVTRTYRPGSVSIFNVDGSLDRTFGREGPGPEEFSRAHQILVGPGDTLFIRDAGRVAAWSPDLVPQWTVNVRGWDRDDIALVPNGLLLAYQDPSATPPTRLDVLARDGGLLKSFGDGDQPYNEVNGSREIAVSAQGDIWSGWPAQYRLDRFNLDGELLQSVSHDLPEFKAYEELDQQRAPGRLVDLMADSVGRIWILLSVADPSYEPPQAHDPSNLLSTAEVTKKVDSLIDVLDPGTGQIIARLRVDRFLAGFASSHVYGFTETSMGVVLMDVWALHLEVDG